MSENYVKDFDVKRGSSLARLVIYQNQSSAFSILFTVLLVFNTKKYIKILQLTKVTSHFKCFLGNEVLMHF